MTETPDTVRIFAFDHRSQLEELPGATPERIGAFKQLCLRTCLAVADGRDGYGLLCDSRLGLGALDAATGQGLWIGRPTEWPGSRPLRLEPELGDDLSGLSNWHADHIVKVLCFCHPDDDASTWAGQLGTLRRLQDAARTRGLQFLLEVVPSKVGRVGDDTTGDLIRRLYAEGLRPDWWKLEPMSTDAAWASTIAAIEENDPQVRGIVVLGLGAEQDALAASFRKAARHPLVKGFAVGRTIFADTARAWLAGDLADDPAVATMAENYRQLCALWDEARAHVARTAA